jgi:DNA-binding transcriptional LysR family regulator
MELRQANYVVAVVEHGGFGRAARALGVSQPTVSQSISALEHELGVALFHRVGRRVTLTAAGAAFLEPARQLQRDAAIARQAVRDVQAAASGRLDLVALPTLAVDPLAPLIGRFRTTYPAITVRLVEPEDAAAVATMVRDGRCELGFAQLPVGQGLAVIELGPQEIMAVCPPGTAVPKRGRLAVDAVAAEPLVATPRGTSTRDLIEHALAGATVAPSIAVETGNREALLPLVLSGAGTCFLPAPQARRAAELGAVVIGLDPPVRRRVGMIHRRAPLSPAAAAFIALVGDEGGDHGGRRAPRAGDAGRAGPSR